MEQERANEEEYYRLSHHKSWKGGLYKGFFWTFVGLAAFAMIFDYFRSKKEMAKSHHSHYSQTSAYTPPVINEVRYPAAHFLQIQTTHFEDIFWAFRMSGTIINTAPVTYQDAVLEITFYSQTGSELGYKDYTLYKFFAPETNVNFDIKETDPTLRHANHISYRIVGATIVND